VTGQEDGLDFEDGQLKLADGRTLAWRWWGARDARPVLRLQGTPASRLYRNPDPTLQKDLGVAYLMADRPGYGGSTRLPNRGIAQFAGDLAELLDSHGLDRVPVMGTSGGGPHALAFAALQPERTSATSVIVGGAPLEPDEAAKLVGVNAEGYLASEKGWDALFDLLKGASGYVESIDALAAGIASLELGAGRARKEDRIDPAAGLVIEAPVGAHVEAGDALVTVHARSADLVEKVTPRLLGAWRISEREVARPPHVLARID
jgi:pimeloyl-ACP methyl ester carboxylesterase